MTVTLAQIRAKQALYRDAIKAWAVKRGEVESLKSQFHQADMELDQLVPAARQAMQELKRMGTEFALQIEDDFTPVIHGTEQPNDPWTPEDSHHPQIWDPDDPGLYMLPNPEGPGEDYGPANPVPYPIMAVNNQGQPIQMVVDPISGTT